MPTTSKMHEITSIEHPAKSDILKKLAATTRSATAASLLSLLKKKGASEVSHAELRKRLSSLKPTLSQEITAARKTR